MHRRVPLWHFAALPHTTTATLQFLLLTADRAMLRGVRGGMPFGSSDSIVICCGQISPRSQNTQSGEKLFAWVPLRIQASGATK